MKRVVIESPFKGKTPEEQAENVRYARACLLDSLRRGEAPFASHLLYTQVLDDALAAERELGIAAGLDLVRDFELTAVYVDRGVSEGMLRGVADAGFANRSYEVRALDADAGRNAASDADLPLRAAWQKARRCARAHAAGFECEEEYEADT